MEGTKQHFVSHDPKVKVKSGKAGICDGVSSAAFYLTVICS